MNNYDIIFAPVITEKSASLEQNGVYTFKGYAKGGGTFNESYFYVKGFGGEDKSVSIDKTGGDWKEFTITGIEVINGKCQVGIYSDGKANAWIRVDDLSLISQ